ncbi:MAG: gamma-butyrobetaine hydroxylase-like domain-containing protein [Candidatus Methylomirabilales bacterium]
MRVSTDPSDYQVDEAKRQLYVRWRDGHESHYSFDELREVCPCADCRTATAEKPQGGGLQVLTGPVIRREEIRIVQISPVGRYALSFTWSDGHSTGIYSFDFLRRLCPCEVCRSGAG